MFIYLIYILNNTIIQGFDVVLERIKKYFSVYKIFPPETNSKIMTFSKWFNETNAISN